MTEQHQVHCDCGEVVITLNGSPRVHAHCHCEDCRNLLQVPYHSVLAWDGDQVSVSKGADALSVFQSPTSNMTRAFCQHCGEVLYNTNAMGWKIVSQWLYRKNHNDMLPESCQPNAHFFYDRRTVNIDDVLPKR